MSDEKKKSNLTTNIVISLIGLLLGGALVYFYMKSSANGDSPIIIADGGLGVLRGISPRGTPGTTIFSYPGGWTNNGAAGYTANLKAASWYVGDYVYEALKEGGSFTLPSGLKVKFGKKQFIVVPSNGNSCTANQETLSCTDLFGTPTIPASGTSTANHDHLPLTYTTYGYFLVFPQHGS